MSDFKRKGEKTRYSFLNERCIGRVCWAPGMFQHRSPLSCGGSRNTGSPDSPCCMTRAYRGCPAGPDGEYEAPDEVYGIVKIQGTPEHQPDLAKKRKSEGWKCA